MVLYFAYGSNMSKDRLVKRGVEPIRLSIARLDDHELLFNKRSKKDPANGFANVGYRAGETVHGVLYWVKEHHMQKLDKFEGAPVHYYRKILPVTTNLGTYQAVVYVAKDVWLSETCEPTNEYLDFLLAGKAFLPDAYYERIKKLKK